MEKTTKKTTQKTTKKTTSHSTPKAEVGKASKTSSKVKWILSAGVAIAVLAGIVGFVCVSKDTDVMLEKTAGQTGVVVAKINGQEVRMSELEKIKNTVPQLKAVPMEQVYNQLLDGYINNKVILAAAEKMDLKNRPEIKQMLEDTKNQILFQAVLAEKIRERMKPEDLTAIYNEEVVAKFVPQDEMRARHILVATEKEANDILAKLKAGSSFEDMVQQFSLDNAANNGGDLGYFTKEMIVEDFAKAAFAMKKGEISKKPVKTPFGYHIIKVEDIRKTTPPAIELVNEGLIARYAERAVPQIIAEERQKANVEIINVFEKESK